MILAAHNLTLSYPGFREPVLKDISLDIRPGEFVLIAGESGSGKSSLLNCLSGLIPHVIPGRIDGSVWLKGTDIREIPSWEIGKELAMVFQQPEDQFFTLRVSEELPFAPINYGVYPDKIHSDMDRVARDMAIESLLPKSMHVLSEGQKKRVAVAAGLMMDPSLFLFDEPLSNLDEGSRQRFALLIERLIEGRKTIVLSEHRMEPFLDRADRLILLDEGTVHYDGRPKDHKVKGEWKGACTTNPVYRPHNAQSVIRVSDVLFGFHKKSSFLLKVREFSAQAGEVVTLRGPNGCGKTTLLRLLSGFLIPQQGEIRICGIAPHCYPAEKRGQILRMVYQNPDHQLFMPDSFSEVMFPLNVKKGRDDDESVETACAIMDRLGLLKLKGRHPHTLSLGEKKRLAIASALFHKPAVLLLDEPTTGIDRKNVQNLVILLKEYGSHGTTIIIASHDDALTRKLCHREVVIDSI